MSQVRQERVARGSRRKRDLDAVAPVFDYDAYAQEHFPGEIRVRRSAHAVYLSQGKTGVPDPKEVWALMQARGETRAQLEAKYGELA